MARIAGRIIGRVMCQKICLRLAPSICACSNGSLRQREQRGQQRQRDERRPVPDVHHHRDREGGVGIAADVQIDSRTSPSDSRG